jgi:GT2 family glycosyltransferase
LEKSKKKLNIYAVIVVYNKCCRVSPSCMSVLKQELIPIIVDNSTSDYGNKEFSTNNNCIYINMHGNKGLSKAYNAALDYLDGKEGVVVWLDDDTQVSNAFFVALKRSIANMIKTQVFLPVVFSISKSENILSPCLYGRYKMRRPKSLNYLFGKRISAINSGMAVRLEVYKSYRYDESLFLDCIDHDFMCMCHDRNIKISLVDEARVYQDFSGDKANTGSVTLNRFMIFKKDFRRYQKKYGRSQFLTDFILAQRYINILIQLIINKSRIKLRIFRNFIFH